MNKKQTYVAPAISFFCNWGTTSISCKQESNIGTSDPVDGGEIEVRIIQRITKF